MAARMAGTPRRHRARTVILVVLTAVLAAGLIYALGPRPSADTTITFDPASLPDDLDAYLAAEEARFPDIRPGNSKQIVWAYPESRARTSYAIVYIHGFSAGPGEVRPLPDIIGRELGANIFYARLTGHGRSGDAMLDGSVRHWVNDLAEALAVGCRLGERSSSSLPPPAPRSPPGVRRNRTCSRMWPDWCRSRRITASMRPAHFSSRPPGRMFWSR